MSNRLWEDVAEIAMDYIEAKAEGRNELREVYRDQLSRNRWRNDGFNALIDTACAVIDFYAERHERRTRSEAELIERCVEDFIDGHFAKSCLADRRTSRELPDDIYRDMQRAADDCDDAIDWAEEQSRRGGRGRRDDRDDRDRHSRRGGRDDRHERRSYRHDRDDRDYRRDDRRGYGRREERESVEMGIDALLSAEPAPRPSRNRDIEETRERQRPHRDDPIPEPAAPVREREREEPRREASRVEGPDYTKARPYDDFWISGEHYVAAHKCDWSLTPIEGDPLSHLPKLYNVNENIKYKVKDVHGNVREELIQVTDDNRYLAHELLADPQAVQKPVGGISLKRRQNNDEGIDLKQEDVAPKKATSLTDCLGDIPKPELDMENDSLQISDSTIAANFVARRHLTEAGGAARMKYFMLRTPLIAKSFDQFDLIDEVQKSTTLAQAAEKMRELKERFEEPIWNELNKRFTELVLRAVRFQFQVTGIRSMSFADDWGKLIDFITKKRGAEFAAEFARRTNGIVNQACARISREEAAEHLDDLVDKNQNIPVILFVDFLAVIAVDAKIDDLGIGKQLDHANDGAVVTGASDPDLDTALRVIKRGVDAVIPQPCKARIIISSADNRMVEVYPYSERQGNYIFANL